MKIKDACVDCINYVPNNAVTGDSTPTEAPVCGDFDVDDTYDEGFDDGYAQGHAEGYAEGYEVGREYAKEYEEDEEYEKDEEATERPSGKIYIACSKTKPTSILTRIEGGLFGLFCEPSILYGTTQKEMEDFIKSSQDFDSADALIVELSVYEKSFGEVVKSRTYLRVKTLS